MSLFGAKYGGQWCTDIVLALKVNLVWEAAIKTRIAALVGVGWLEGRPIHQRWQIRFLVKTHAQLLGSFPLWDVCKKQPIDLFLSLSKKKNIKTLKKPSNCTSIFY